MGYMLDTNVLSETVRLKPNPHVMTWYESIPDTKLYTSVIVLGEVRKGIEKMQTSQRRTQLTNWLEHDLTGFFEDRLLPVDLEVAERWGYLMAYAKRPLPPIDVLIAATALAHNLRVVTRNIGDFDLPGVEVVNPWL